MGDFAQHSIYGYATSWFSPNFSFAKTSYMLKPLYKIPSATFIIDNIWNVIRILL